MRYLRPSSPILLRGPAILVGLFILFSGLWIFTTDQLVAKFLPNSVAWHTAKGMLYVSVAAVLLFVLCHKMLVQFQRTERTLSKIFMQSEFGVCLVAPDGTFLDSNPGFARIMGYTTEELVGMNLRRLVHEDSVRLMASDWQQELGGERPVGFVRERKYVRKNGSIVWVRIAASRIDPGRKQKPFMVAVVQDMTTEVETADRLKRQQTELRDMLTAVQESEARFRRLVESMSTGVMICKEDGLVTDANDVLLRLLSYTREDLKNGVIRWSEITPPEYREMDLLAIEELRQTGRFSPFEKEYSAKDGTRIPVLLAGAATRDSEIEAVITVTDLRDARRAEAQLSTLVLAVENAFESIMITDLNANIVYVNQAFETLSGYTRTEAINKNARVLRSGASDDSDFEQMWSALQAGESWKGRLWSRRKDGSENLEDVTATNVRDAGGRIINYLIVKRDITREHALEGRLVQSQKLQAVGQLAGGVAHDVNNILQAVQSCAELGLRRSDEPAYVKRKFEDILTASQRGAGIVAQLMAFTRKQETKPSLTSLNAAITETGTMLRRLLPANVELVMNLSSDLKTIRADRVQLSQVLMNLAVNARDAMSDGGLLRISTMNRSSDGKNNADQVRLTVQDNGTGMEESVRLKIFEPFFTTKEAGKGTGLGLATVAEIVQQCNGSISVESKVGEGTEFHLDFPAYDVET